MKISFIGFGNMAKAIADALVKETQYELRASSPQLPLGINEQGIKTTAENISIVKDADIVILAVKPSMMDMVMKQISPHIPSQSLLISIAAGIQLAWFNKYVPTAAIVRAMPNIAATVGRAATPLRANEFVTSSKKNLAEELFSCIGLTTWVQHEIDIDAFTALSGSGPAYVFMFMEAMIHGACALGIAPDIAKLFTLQTFEGALVLAKKSLLTLDELRKTVTSPAGTTAAALDVLSKHGVDASIQQAMQAAYDRAQQLGAL